MAEHVASAEEKGKLLGSRAHYHRERAIVERRAALRARDLRARRAHLELARQHDLLQAIAWHHADIGLAAPKDV